MMRLYKSILHSHLTKVVTPYSSPCLRRLRWQIFATKCSAFMRNENKSSTESHYAFHYDYTASAFGLQIFITWCLTYKMENTKQLWVCQTGSYRGKKNGKKREISEGKINTKTHNGIFTDLYFIQIDRHHSGKPKKL